MILEALAISAIVGGIQTARKGIPVASGSVGDVGTNDEIKWRARWAIWRWIAEVRSPSIGWTVVGDFKTREMAEANAKAAAQNYRPNRVGIMRAVKIR